jgi:hypothetical protein
MQDPLTPSPFPPHSFTLCPRQSTFFGGWKMEALLRQAGWLAQALGEVRSMQGPLMAFVPTCYLELMLDILSAYRWGG